MAASAPFAFAFATAALRSLVFRLALASRMFCAVPCYDLIVVRRSDLGRRLVEAIKHLTARQAQHEVTRHAWHDLRAVGATDAVAVAHHSTTVHTYRTGARCGLHWHDHRMVVGHGNSVLIVNSAAWC
jgi:hypothetical protein